VAGVWKRLHNEELHKLYSSTNIIRVIKSKIGEARSTHEMINAYKIVIGNPEGVRSFLTRRWVG